MEPRLEPRCPQLALLLLTRPFARAESYSTIALPNANSHTARTLQEDNTDLAYECDNPLFEHHERHHQIVLTLCPLPGSRAQISRGECLCFLTHRTMRAHASRLVVLTACACAWQYTAENLSGTHLQQTICHSSPPRHHYLTLALCARQKRGSTRRAVVKKGTRTPRNALTRVCLLAGRRAPLLPRGC